MPSGNFDEPVTPAPPPALPHPQFLFPSDYYCAPLTDVRPIFSRRVPIGCRSASAVILVLLLAGGAALTGPRLVRLMDFVLGMSLGETRGMFAPNVTPAQKMNFETEVKRMREALRRDQISTKTIQPFLKAMQSAIADKKVTPEELERLTRSAHEAAVSTGAAQKSQSRGPR